MFGWRSISAALAGFLLVTGAVTNVINFSWALPAPVGYVQLTAKELQEYVLKQVGELKPTLNMLVKHQLEGQKRTEETRKSEYKEKINKARQEVEVTDHPRTRQLLQEQIAQSLENIEKTDKEISKLDKQLKAIEP